MVSTAALKDLSNRARLSGLSKFLPSVSRCHKRFTIETELSNSSCKKVAPLSFKISSGSWPSGNIQNRSDLPASSKGSAKSI